MKCSDRPIIDELRPAAPWEQAMDMVMRKQAAAGKDPWANYRSSTGMF